MELVVNFAQVEEPNSVGTGAQPEDQPTFAPSTGAPLAGSLDAVLQAPLEELDDSPPDDILTSWSRRISRTPSPPGSDQEGGEQWGEQRRRLSRGQHVARNPGERRRSSEQHFSRARVEAASRRAGQH